MAVRVEPGDLSASPPASASPPRPSPALALAALFLCAWAAILSARGGIEAREWVPVLIAVAWTAAGTVVSVLRPRERIGPIALTACVIGAAAVMAAAIGLAGSNERYERSRGIDRQRMQWVGLGIAVAMEIAIVAFALHALLGWPPSVITISALGTLPVPVALALSSAKRIAGSVGSLLAHAISLAGLTGVVGGVYFVIVLGLGRAPHE